MTITVNFIGCGRLGKTIAKLIKDNSIATIGCVLNTSFKSSLKAVEFIGAGNAIEEIEELSPADYYFITTRDDTIERMCTKLAASNRLKTAAIVIHCSGSLSSDILSSAKKRNCYVVSAHPIKSFANPEESVQSFPGTFCAVEGDIEAVIKAKALFEQIGAKVFSINKDNKSLYHAAGVMANNYLVTLHYQAVECYKSAGIDEDTANKIVSMMMNDALVNLRKLPHIRALTGPLQRGDTGTIKKHIEALKSEPLRTSIYSKLGLGTLPLTSHSPEVQNDLEKILGKEAFDEELLEQTTPTIKCRL